MRVPSKTWLGLAVLSSVLAAPAARAHPLAPGLLQLEAAGGGRFDVLWRLPRLRARGTAFSPRLPAHCRALGAPLETAGPRHVDRTWRVDCGGDGLVGAALEIADLAAPSTVVVRVVFDDGRVADGIVTADAPRFVVPPAPRPGAVALGYARLGLGHIASGPDHLLFVLGLVLLAATWRRVVATVTAFTVGHSVTLALAALGLVALPAGPIELAIAASVLVVAVQVARRAAAAMPTRDHAWPIAASFGLLHGLGFAAALTEAGLPASGIALALLAFNLGIELGQLAFIVVLAALATIVRRPLAVLPRWTARVPAYVMGTLAAYWCFERTAVWLGS